MHVLRFPSRWWHRWEKRADHFGGDGTGYATLEMRRRARRARLQALARCTLGGLEAEESAAFKPVLLGILRFEPDERMSAEEVARLLPCVCGI